MQSKIGDYIIIKNADDVSLSDWNQGRWIECQLKKTGRWYDVISYELNSNQIRFLYRNGDKGQTNPTLCRQAVYTIKDSVNINGITHVKQELGKVCGLAVMEMIFKFHNIHNYSQFDIGRSLVMNFQNKGRYKNSAFLNSGMQDWNVYPGTGTYYMREFMENYTKVDHHQIETFPAELKNKVRNAFMHDLKAWLSQSVPVVIHQQWSKNSAAGHYRIVTGYNESSREFYLMDPRPGQITQSYADFVKLWESDEKWLNYTFLVYHVDRSKRKALSKTLKISL